MSYTFRITHEILPPPMGEIEYVYNDEQIIIVDKPANLVSRHGRIIPTRLSVWNVRKQKIYTYQLKL